jgi:hypothetical protein
LVIEAQRHRPPQFGLVKGRGTRVDDHRTVDVCCRLDRRAVLQHRLATADLLQGQLAAFVVQLLEAIQIIRIRSADRTLHGIEYTEPEG